MSHSASPPLNGANRFAHIDALRAFAVMLVVVAHAGLGHIIPGGSGVTIFFSISGFIITYLLLRERDNTGGFSASGFYFRRVLKIGPPLVLVIVIPTLVFSIWNKVDWDGFLAQVFFFYNWWHLHGEGNLLAGTAVVWSLSIEEQFYIVFALVWFFAVKSPHWRSIVAAAAATGVVYSTAVRLLMAPDPALDQRLYYGSDTRLDGIAWGVLAAVAFHFWHRTNNQMARPVRALGSDWTLVGAVVVYILSLVIRDDWFRDTFRFTLQSLAACAVIIYGLMPGEGRLRRVFYVLSAWRAVSLIGLASYSIYLVHFILIKWLAPHIDIPLLAEVLVLTFISVIVGVALYKLVEVPIHAWGVGIRQRNKSAKLLLR